jgi:hypothetical protein
MDMYINGEIIFDLNQQQQVHFHHIQLETYINQYGVNMFHHNMPDLHGVLQGTG